MELPLNFVERKNCSFGEGNNLKAKDGYMRAMEYQSIKVDLPDVEEICGLSLASSKQDLHYDDYLFITLNQKVLVSSEEKWTSLLDDVNGFKQFDFLKLRDQEHKFVEEDPNYGTPYCYGDANCMVPDHDETGAFTLNVDEKSIAAISDMGKEAQALEFTAIATGDDDDEDCDFSSFALNLKLKYIPKSAK